MRKLTSVLLIALFLIIPFNVFAYQEIYFDYEVGQQVTKPLDSADNTHIYNFTAYATQRVNVQYTCVYSRGNFAMFIYELGGSGAVLFNSTDIPDTNLKQQEINLVSGQKYQIVIRSIDGRATPGVPYQFSIIPKETDPSGNTYDGAVQTTIGTTLTGEITNNYDADFYKFTATGNEVIRTYFFTNWKTGGQGWYRMKIIDSVTKEIVADSDLVLHPENSWGSALNTFTTVSGRNYVIVVYSQDGASNQLPYQVLISRL